MKITLISCLWCYLYLFSGKIFIESYNILGVFPHKGRSHHMFIEPFLEQLAVRGHNLTVITYFPNKNPPKNWKDINLNVNNEPSMELSVPVTDKEMLFSEIAQYIHNVKYLIQFGYISCDNLLKNSKVQDLALNHNNEYDLIIVEQFNSDCALGWSYQFKAPIIGIMSHALIPWHYARFGVSKNPSYEPSIFFGFPIRTDFVNRLKIFTYDAIAILWFKKHQLQERELLRKYNYIVPDLEEVSREVSLLLINQYFPLTGSRLLPANIIEVSGLHIGNSKPLDPELDKFVNESTHGVVYLSFGTLVMPSTISKEKLDSILATIRELPQRFIWKWNADSIPGAPKNLLLKKWLPQLDLLSHKNVKGFVSHGGMLGTSEAIHCGVPMVVMPQFGDQPANAARVKESGLGVVLKLSQLTKDNFLVALKDILSVERQTKAKELSSMWHDRPVSPMDTAIFWAEYVAKYRAPKSLISPAVDVPFYQYLCLDIVAFILLTVFILLFILKKMLSVIFKMLNSIVKRSIYSNAKQKKG